MTRLGTMIPFLSGRRNVSPARCLWKCFAFALFLLLQCAAHSAPIVVSGWFTAVGSNDDSPYEYAQFVATQDIDFSVTPFTLVWNDVGPANSTGTASFSDGWAGGSLLSYAFQLTTGTVTRGEEFYVGGSAQRIMGPGSTSLAGLRWLRTIDTSVSPGDGLGEAHPDGVFGNGGANADGIAVFSGLANAITSTTVPVDSVFFGTGVGTAHPANGGFKAADNDHYTSAGVFGDAGNSFFFGDPGEEFLRLSGTYNWATQQWDVPRTGAIVFLDPGSQPSAIESQLALVPEPSAGVLVVSALALFARRRQRGAGREATTSD